MKSQIMFSDSHDRMIDGQDVQDYIITLFFYRNKRVDKES